MINYKKVFLKWVVKKLYSAGIGIALGILISMSSTWLLFPVNSVLKNKKKCAKHSKSQIRTRFSIRTNSNTPTYRPPYTTPTVLELTFFAFRRRLLTTSKTGQSTMPSPVPISITKVFCSTLGKKLILEKTCK